MIKYIILCTILMSLVYSCSSPSKKETENELEVIEVNENIPEVKAKLLEYQDFHYEVISNGTIASMNKAELRFQSQDQILRIYVKNGQRVMKGQKLAELDDFKLKNSMNQAIESLERAKLDLQDVLIGQGYSLNDSLRIPPEVMKIARIRSNYDQSQNNYIMSTYNLNAATLYAPFGGVIANLTMKEYNQPGSDPFCLIIDNQKPEVIFHILENELSLIHVNDKVIVSPFSQSSYAVEGRVSEINPLIDKNGMVMIKAIATNKDNQFYEGMNVKVRVQRLLGKQLIVPKSSLVLRTNKKVVFTLKNDKAIWNYVETAQENSDSYVISAGLNAGDSIIYEGNLNLAHESSVMIKE